VLGRLLERFQQCIETRLRQHVHLVDEIHLVAAARGPVLRVVEQIAGGIDAGTRRRVDLDEIGEAAGRNLTARAARPTRRGGDTGLAVERLGEQPRDGRLADAAGAGEQIGMVHAVAVQRMHERAHDVLLADEGFEAGGPQLAGQYLIAHVSIPVPGLPGSPRSIPGRPQTSRQRPAILASMGLDSDFLIIGHRGAAGLAPENTLASFRLALEYAVNAVELDVHAVDDTLVVIHDDTLDRTTNGTGPLTAASLPALRVLDAGAGERVPLLDEVLDLIAGRVAVNVELKGAGTAALLARKLPDLDGCTLIVSSFDHGELATFHGAWQPLRDARGLTANVHLAPLFGRHRIGMFRVARRLSAWSIHLSLRLATPALLRSIRRRGYRALVYTVNDPETARRLRDDGASGIFTDYPNRMRAL
jgi:glycerophosphoryl diester phosphodiesterase